MFKKPTPIIPEIGQESVWNYPRPAILEDTNKHLKVVFNNIIIAETCQGKRVLETSHPPVYYFPPQDVKLEYLRENSQKSYCEWKGVSSYYDIIMGDKIVKNASWSYLQPTSPFITLKGYYAFYVKLMDACYVNDELVTPQPGNFYGGWITKDIVGPFKGEPGTMGW